jgi:hypothetical protein
MWKQHKKRIRHPLPDSFLFSHAHVQAFHICLHILMASVIAAPVKKANSDC